MHAPEDLAIVGFDNIDAADFVELTTVDQSLEQSGKLATEVLLSRLEGKITVIQNIELQAQLLERVVLRKNLCFQKKFLDKNSFTSEIMFWFLSFS